MISAARGVAAPDGISVGREPSLISDDSPGKVQRWFKAAPYYGPVCLVAMAADGKSVT